MEKDVPYIVFEGTIARFERTTKRLIIALIILVVLLFASNLAWLYAWNLYDYSDVTVDGTDGGAAAYMGDGSNGVINNGESGSKEANQEE